MYNQQAIDTYLEYIQTYEHVIITESQMEQFLLEMPDVSNKVIQFVKWGEKSLKSKYNISVEPIKQLAKKQANVLKYEFKKGTPPEQVGEKVSSSIKNFMTGALKNATKQVGNLTVTKKVIIGIASFFVIIFTSSLIMGLVGPLVGPQLITQLTVVVIAPMVEEAAKTFFITQGMPWVGTGVVFGIEGVMYLVQLFFGGFRMTRAIILRLSTLLMHFATTFVQKKIIDSKKTDEENGLFIAWATGVAIHASWNTLALLSNDKVTAFLIK